MTTHLEPSIKGCMVTACCGKRTVEVERHGEKLTKHIAECDCHGDRFRFIRMTQHGYCRVTWKQKREQ